MNIKYKKSNEEKIREVNFYFEDEKQKLDTPKATFLNFKIEKNYNRRKFMSLIKSIIVKVKSEKFSKIAFNYQQIRDLKIDEINFGNFDRAKIFVENLIIAEYKFDKYLSKKDRRIDEILIFGDFQNKEKEGFAEAKIVADGVNIARNLANTPGSDMTPTILEQEIRKMFQGLKNIKISVIDEKKAEALGMNLFLAVARGSKEEAKMIIVEYNGGKIGDKRTVYLGKGITYDTGGLSLKPTLSMLGMEKDMTGAATVVSALYSIAHLGLKKNITAVAIATENAISDKAYKPGDLLKSMSGITVEVKNTDAEGRLALADALTYIVKNIKPVKIIDVATLTGAASVALGERASALMTKNEEMGQTIREIGEKTGDFVWPLPLWDEYEEEIKGELADIANIGKTAYGGTIAAGIFLYQFVKEAVKDGSLEWAHLDISPRMNSIKDDNLEYGATGEPVRLLVEYAKNL